jgi:amino acid adenylation domain-containing protein
VTRCYRATLLEGAPDHLPVGRHQARDVTDSSRSVDVVLPAEVVAAATELGRECETTLHVVMTTLFELFLGAWSGQTLAAAGNVVPFDLLLNRLAPSRTTAQPYDNVNVTLHTTPRVAAAEFGKGFAEVAIPFRSARFDLDLDLWPDGPRLSGSLAFRVDVITPAEAVRLRDELLRFVEAAVRDPAAALGDLARHADLAPGGRDAALDWPVRFAAVVETHHDEPAIVLPDGCHVSYRRLEATVARIAAQLEAVGVAAGDRVLIRAERDGGAVAAMLAVLDRRAVFTPVDSSDPVARVRAIEAVLEPTATLDVGAFSSLDDWDDPPLTVEFHGRAQALDDLTPGYMIFTSGSTGVPKGVRVGEPSLLRYSDWAALEYQLAHGAGAPLATSLSVDLTLTSIFGTLLAGRPIHTAPRETYPGEALRTLLRGRAGHEPFAMVKLTPSHLVAVEDVVDAAGPQTSSRTWVLGGEALFKGTVDPLCLERGVRVYNEYGPTEATVACLAFRLPPGPQPEDLIPIGTPIARAVIDVVDEDGAPVPPGQPGELLVSGPVLALGYWRDEEATAARFGAAGRPRRYVTGDLVRVDPGGRLVFVGRRDGQVKVRGRRLELAEVEAVAAGVAGVATAQCSQRVDGSLELVLVPSRSRSERASGAESAGAVSLWQGVFDEIYADPPATGDDLAGWTTSVDRRPVAAEAMAEWADALVARLAAYHPQAVLELGCGTGLVMSRLLESVGSYVGVDFSENALASARRRLEEPDLAPFRERATLTRGDVRRPPEGQYDAVILNSVVQYLDSGATLERTLSVAVDRVRPGGVLVLGDLRPPELDDALARDLAARRKQPGTHSGPDLEDWATDRVLRDPELRVGPGWLHVRLREDGRVARVVMRPRVCRHVTEMSEYRYDCFVELAGPATPMPEVELSDVGVEIEIAERCLGLLGELPAGRGLHLRSVRWRRYSATDELPGVRPAELEALAASTGHSVAMQLAEGVRFDAFAATFVPLPAEAAAVEPVLVPRAFAATLAEPDRRDEHDGAALLSQVREAISRRVGAWACPDEIRIASTLTLGPSGKAERVAPVAAPSLVPGPAAAAERRGEAWLDIVTRAGAELLEREIGAEDNFFQVGGDSLLCVHLVRRLREVSGHDIPMRIPFDQPVFGAMAATLHAEFGAATREVTEERPGS